MNFQPDTASATVAEAIVPVDPKPLPARRTLVTALRMPGAFRLLLATAVVVNHYTKLQIGTAAVELFFILSGYWIDRMYARQYSRMYRPALVFIGSRIMRLMPMFLMFSIIAIIIQNLLGTKVAINHLSLSIVPNFIILGYASLAERPLVPAWSLDIELQFYLLFPLIWRVIPARPKPLGWAVLGLLCAGGVYLGFGLQDQSTMFLPYLGFFGVGVFASRSEWKPGRGVVWLGIILALAVVATSLALPFARGAFVAADALPAREWNTAGNIVLALCLAPLAISTVWRKSTPLDRTLGDLSYAVYCSHWIGVAIAAYYFAGASWQLKLPFIAAAVAATYVASLIALLWFDRPVGHLRENWIHRQPMRVAKE